eukprot:3875263-Lingulodinium_polyedra.AAC.1
MRCWRLCPARTPERGFSLRGGSPAPQKNRTATIWSWVVPDRFRLALCVPCPATACWEARRTA